jgi:hypothetical protein
MRAIFLAIATLTLGTAAIAQDAPTAAPSAPSEGLTLKAAKKARYLAFGDRGGADIYTVDAGSDGGLGVVEIVFDSRMVHVSGATVSATDKPSRLKTSLTYKEVSKLP